jgi:hypothetical protein
MFSVWGNAINELPDEIKLKYPKVYTSGILAQEHKWKEILLFTDTVKLEANYNLLNLSYDKCVAHFNINNDDSSLLYAKKYVELSRTKNMTSNLISRNGAYFKQPLFQEMLMQSEFLTKNSLSMIQIIIKNVITKTMKLLRTFYNKNIIWQLKQ